MYETVRKSPVEVHSILDKWENNEEEYYRLRKTKPATLNTYDRAARFIYLNRYCFNGLYRTNNSGDFNVPYGGVKSGNTPTLEMLRESSRLLARSKLIRGDFVETVSTAQKDDFVYLDPPFTIKNRRIFTEYDTEGFGFEDMTRLHNLVHDLDRRGSTFLLSYADCDEGKQISTGFTKFKVRTKRNIAGFVGNRRSEYELIVTNAVSKT